MAATNLEKQAPPTDTTVLGRNYLMATDEAIEIALRALEFEMAVRQRRANVHREILELSQQRLAEVRSEIEAVDAEFDTLLREKAL